MNKHFILLSLFLCSCEKKPPENNEQSISVAAHEFLSPNDLNIQKMRFTAHPSKDQVAIFRSGHHSAIDPLDHQTYDQIMWTNGEEAHKDVIIANRSFYVDYSDPEVKTSENIFRDSWRLHAGGYSYDINDYSFVRSEFNSKTTEATGEVVYTKKTKSETEDLVFKFRMFVVSLEEAKAMHPKLEISYDKSSTGWEAAYLVTKKTEQDVDGKP